MAMWAKIVCVNVVFLAILLAVLDVALRLTPLDAARSPFAKLPNGYYVPDPELGIAPARNVPTGRFSFRGPGHEVFTNELGCFDRPLTLGANEPYVLALGDSFAWGFSSLEGKWTSRIERKTGVRVLKCGLLGTGTRYQLALLKRLVAALPYPPALVIHLYDTTDFSDDLAFPKWQAQDGRRVPSFRRLRLADGNRVPLTEREIERFLEAERGARQNVLERHSTLYNVGRVVDLFLKRKERRASALRGEVVYFKHRNDFNAMLLDPAAYPLVAQMLREHIDTLRRMRETVVGFGARYALFHTNSFRLPLDRPLVETFNAFLADFPPFLGRMPELPRYLFDPHWAPEAEATVARVMVDRLRARGYFPLRAATVGRSFSNRDDMHQNYSFQMNQSNP